MAVLLAPADIAAMIDHSLLRPELTDAEVRAGCLVAAEQGSVSVCARPSDVAACRRALAGSPVRVTTVVGFPHGSSATAVKAAEARRALEEGAVELDMVIHVGKLRSGEHAYVGDDIRAVVEAAHAAGALVKVILETVYLSDDEKRAGCRLVEAAGADFVKTSTGFAPSGATIADLLLMRAACGPRVQVKAAGGVRTLDDALAVRAAGATRFGATQTVAIMDEARRRAARGTLVLPASPGRLSSEGTP